LPFLLVLLIAFVCCLFWSSNVSAVSRVWDGGGSTNNWTEAANWSGDIVPGAGDIAVFNSTSVKNATINAAIDVAGIQIASGYTGTVTQASGRDITIGSSGFTQAAGFFAGANLLSPIDINGPFTLTGGQFTSTGVNLTVSGNFTRGAGIFFNNGGKVTFDGGNASISISGSEFFFNVSFSADDQAVKTLTPGSTLVVNGTLDFLEGKVSGGAINAQSNLFLGAGADGGTTVINVSGGTATLNAGEFFLP